MDALSDLYHSLNSVLGASVLTIGDTSINAGSLLKLAVFIFLAVWFSKFARLGMQRLFRARGAHPSSIYTLDRLSHYMILSLGLVLGLAAVGFDFTSVALVAGALGLGVGLGLQPLVTNFFAGVILLLDRSVKVSDYVELESGTRGQVKKINIRYTLINTNDNVDVLVPNSELVTARVVNWTMEEEATRVHVPFGVAYGSDKEAVRAAALEAAEAVPDEFAYESSRPPQVWFVGFGDSSLDFELLIWLGPRTVRRPRAVIAAYLWEIHTALEKHDIEVPFPQRDLHLRSAFGLSGEAGRDLFKTR